EILKASSIQKYVDEGETRTCRPWLPMDVLTLTWRWQQTLPVIAMLMRGDFLLKMGDPEEARRRQPEIEWQVPNWPMLIDPAYDLAVHGWHLAYMGGPLAVWEKVRQAAHP